MKRICCRARWTEWRSYYRPLGFLLSLLLTSLPCNAAEPAGAALAAPSMTINLYDGDLTACIVATPLRDVMEEISRLSGARIVWLSYSEEKAVSAEFTALPLSEALRRILGEKNFLLFYASATERAPLTQIWISSQSPSKKQSELTKQLSPIIQTTSESEEETTTSEGEDAGPLVEATLQAALHDQDPVVRIGAIELLESYVGEDPRAKATLSHIAHTATDKNIQEAAAEALSEEE